jgi:hypothetical protein
MILPGIAEFRSPIDGAVIGSRGALSAHERQHNVIQVGNERVKPVERAPLPRAGHDVKRAIETLKG